MTNEQIIQEVASQFFNCAPKDVVIDHRLMGGMSNYTYVINVEDKKYTFRIPGKKAEKFVDRDVEKYHLELVETLGLNNKTIYLDTKTGYKIATYIEGTPLSERNPLDYLEEAAEVLHKIHDSKIKSKYDYAPLKRLIKYENYVKEYGHDHDPRYIDLKSKFKKQAEVFMDDSRLVFTHGDSQISNFITTENGPLFLTDWEFTGNNDPLYDVACFGNNDFDHALALLPVYLGKEPTSKEYQRLYFFRMFQCLQWHNVALYKEFIGLSVDLGIDFMFVANLYLDKADKFYNKLIELD